MTRILGILAACAAIATAGCQNVPGRPREPSPALFSGYTCCNLHYDEEWISDANWSSLPMIPAGASIRVLGYGRHRVKADIDGHGMELGLDYGRQQSLEAWAHKLVIEEDPRPKIARMPTPIRDAIRAGKVTIGMTKAEVIMSLGYPPAHQTPNLDWPQWKYWHTSFGSYLVVWDSAGRVSDVTADPETRAAVLYPPRR
jgi:hypothetical protein